MIFKKNLPQSKYDENGRPIGSNFKRTLDDIKNSLREENFNLDKEKKIEKNYKSSSYFSSSTNYKPNLVNTNLSEENSSNTENNINSNNNNNNNNNNKNNNNNNSNNNNNNNLKFKKDDGRLMFFAILGLILPLIGFFLEIYVLIKISNLKDKRTQTQNTIMVISIFGLTFALLSILNVLISFLI